MCVCPYVCVLCECICLPCMYASVCVSVYEFERVQTVSSCSDCSVAYSTTLEDNSAFICSSCPSRSEYSVTTLCVYVFVCEHV
jgi:hypothetical protein